MVMIKVVVVPRMIGGCDGAGFVSSRRTLRNNFESDHGVLGEDDSFVFDLFEGEDVVTRVSFDGSHFVCLYFTYFCLT